MSDLPSLILAPLLVGLVLLLVEYLVIQPHVGNKGSSREKQVPSPPPTYRMVRSLPERPTWAVSQDHDEGRLTTAELFHYLIIGIISASAGVSVAAILRLVSEEYYLVHEFSLLSSIAEVVATSDFVFIVLVVLSIVSGVLFAFLIDSRFNKASTPTFQRFIVSAVLGFIGACLGLVVIVVLLAYFVLSAKPVNGSMQGTMAGYRKGPDKFSRDRR